MALRFRITAVPASRTQADGPPIVAWENGLVFVDAEAYDDAAPATVLKASKFEYPASLPDGEIYNRITNHFLEMKQANDRITSLQAYVGQSWPLV